ncbi:MAG: NAD(+) diphosphatase [Chloroflexi bacterium]|nr:NAD(+) diphosphatase [Chloroflexota bacterium]
MMNPHVFAGNPLNRGESERRDEEWISNRARDSKSKFLPMKDLNVLITTNAQPELGWLNFDELTRIGAESNPIFLGLLEETAYFTVDISNLDDAVSQLQSSADRRFEDARAASELITGPEAGILAQARSQLDWHNRHGFCSVCGHPTTIQRGGQTRQCAGCNAHHYPRTDPVIIVVVTDGNRCLLGQSRGRMASSNRYSALAGFVDQGESIEEAVTREVMEESGIKIKNIRYHSSQPWPFPSSLMMGFHAEASTTDIAMDAEEMADVQWFEREEVLLALEGKSEKLAVPGPIAIAHHLIKAWATN